jgi:prepilin-type N-terminal cleavage/methylation domain-containing protein
MHRGFTLVEALVSIAISAIAGSVLLLGTTASLQTTDDAMQRTIAYGMRQILSGLSDPIVAIDDYDDVVLANRSARELFQIDAEKTEARALAQLVRCQKLVQLLTSTRQRRTAVHRTDELEIDDGEGRARWYRATAVKLVTNANNDKNTPVAAGAVAVLHDIGDQKALQKRNAEFVSAVSHEMKTPLAGIKAYVELLADGDAEDEQTQEEFLNVMNGQADRDMLLQAAINLLSNAIKYTNDGGRVTLRSRLADDQVTFEVQDTGVGLSEEDSHRVFEKFYRVQKDKNMASGMGLGLPLAKHIVEDVHGGRLAVESVLGQGSTFIVTLPCARQMRGEG